MICDTFDIVAVPFPFVERPAIKRRPALTLSNTGFNERNGHGIFAMITTSRLEIWPDDYAFLHPIEAGLINECYLRLKIFTLPNHMIVKKIGRPSQSDQDGMSTVLKRAFQI